MLTSISRTLPRVGHYLKSAKVVRKVSSGPILEGYGEHLFKGVIAAPFLKAQGLSPTILERTEWTFDGSADKVSFGGAKASCCRSLIVFHLNPHFIL